MNRPQYTCRIHAAPLVESGSLAICPQCPAPYIARDDIWMLDLMNRPDRAAFDEQVLSNPVPLDPEKAKALLDAAGLPSLRGANILDVGCGLGDLTYGLAQSPAIHNSAIYAFDHSVQSLRQAAVNGHPENGNRIFFSAQDAFQLFFPDAFFDLAAGSAVLHHFLDYPGFFHELARVLKPRATAVFSEPFFDGYFWPALFLKNAMEEHGASLDAPEFAGAKIIIGLVDFMSRNRGNTPALEHMTDKHFFRESEILTAADDAGFRSVRFSTVAAPGFYTHWMPHFLDTFTVTDSKVRSSAIGQYDRAATLAGPLLPNMMSHFKFIVLKNG